MRHQQILKKTGRSRLRSNEWVYRETLNKNQLEAIADRFFEELLDEITNKAETLLDEPAR